FAKRPAERETDRPSGGRQPGAPAPAPTCALVLREQHLARPDRRIGPREEDRVGGGGRPDGLDGAHALAILAWEPIADLRGLERLGRLGDAVATIAHRVHRDAEGLERPGGFPDGAPADAERTPELLAREESSVRERRADARRERRGTARRPTGRAASRAGHQAGPRRAPKRHSPPARDGAAARARGVGERGVEEM